ISNNDLLNLLANVNIPVVMVDNELRIRRFTPPAEKLLNLIPPDVGRRLAEIRPNMEGEIHLDQVARETIETATLQELEVRQLDGGWYMMRVRPYKTWDNKIDGAVLSFQDIDNLKRKIDEERQHNLETLETQSNLIEMAHETIIVRDLDGKISF